MKSFFWNSKIDFGSGIVGAVVDVLERYSSKEDQNYSPEILYGSLLFM
jgi:hypothetical protein